ncbi:MAG TPA: 16S rRNA (guanine(527)-N(7))-methyltransferase RsmG [Pseudonocardiaceae bacterium]|nr:16S rRNA (guanine(527)-N(7))-methyltransferase RsmG [Pseudonocardiaceae bacterium]
MFHVKRQPWADIPAAARVVFGEQLEAAERYAAMLAGPGVVRGVIGPREAGKLWARHMLNSAVLGELLAKGERVLDVGSGAGLPGIPLALARPDLTVVLLEPMARRVEWLREVVAALELPVRVHRGRVEDPAVRAELGEWDVVTARAVAPLGRLASWCLPLLVADGRLLAVKGARAGAEVARDAVAVRSAGGRAVDIVQCGVAVVQPPTTVVAVRRRAERVTPRMGTPRRKDR